MSTPLLFHGSIVTPQTRQSAKYLPHALLYVQDGVIKWIEEDVDVSRMEDVLKSRSLQGVKVRTLRRGEFLIPGFIDTHTHAPQFSNLGRGGQLQLLDWLERITFPAESKFGDTKYAEKVYESVVRRLLDCGTTTCCYYGTTHPAGNMVLADMVKASGQRGFIGKCNMNRNAPETLMDTSTEESLESTRALISYINTLNCPRIRPILTPRFAISCTEDLLEGLGKMVTENSNASGHPHLHSHGLPIQTHISENKAEIELTASLFPDLPNYASIYDNYGLLGPTTILAHGCHLTPEEIALIKKRGGGISHCPTSNFNLTSGVAKVGEWLDEGVKVGLGTDVSGGFSPSILTAINHASLASKIVAMQAPSVDSKNEPVDPSSVIATPAETLIALAGSAPKPFANRPLPTATLLHLATLGGAELCNLETYTGSLVPGKFFDALLVNLRPETENPNVWWDFADEQLTQDLGAEDHQAYLEASLEKLFFCGDDRNISAVWVEGNLVGGRQYHADHPMR